MPVPVKSSLDVKKITGSFASNPAATSHVAQDQVGGIITFADAVGPVRASRPRSCEIRNATLLDPGFGAAVAFRLYLFSRLMTVGSADDAAVSIADAEMDYSLGFVDFLAADAGDVALNRIYEGTIKNGSKLITIDDVDGDGVTNEDLALYGLLQVLGTWTSTTTAPTVRLWLARD